MIERQASNTYPTFMLQDLKATHYHLSTEQIERYIENAPDAIKNVFDLYYKQGFSQPYIAKELNTTTSTIRNRLVALKRGMSDVSNLFNHVTLIVGRSSTGKSTLEQKLCAAYDLKPIISYTTREKRTPDEQGHIFITKDEALSPKYKNKIATTEINGHLYFATKEQLDSSHTYVVDPNGLYELLKNNPDKTFNLIYLKPNKRTHNAYLKNRRSQTNETLDHQLRRLAAENQQFTHFEQKLKQNQLSLNLNILNPKKLLQNL